MIRSVLQSRISRSSSRSWIRPLDASPLYVVDPVRLGGSPEPCKGGRFSDPSANGIGVSPPRRRIWRSSPGSDETWRHAPSDSGTLRPNYVFAGSHQPAYEGTKRIPFLADSWLLRTPVGGAPPDSLPGLVHNYSPPHGRTGRTESWVGSGPCDRDRGDGRGPVDGTRRQGGR